ncbi:prolactin-releasing peptide receptor-like [Tribolium castaneum]|uniref:prolactin-releasing peptide receptor-like n=1 Tax=Tribolium castaneum TaxID=7070 RepID=UPI0000D558FC|nr:PREDICTED: prolactin-releasing peptide receptor isoform X1 [Tribolium castaneum]XP_015833196.1 PREDICTED: prolactin-releasing peptide receptor isoform X1 [Tribolium castaneum]XP_966794.1 PREDICTED: prolactin-releasing peptide receptor isoform X1 [Tribolium castaneum]|eukprot:XP_015833194.1 PREDICTED: prolactin-releasing peptide receptor isoform X1 [Tribolium castaneum]
MENFNNSTATNEEWNQASVNATHDIIHNPLVQSIFFMVYTTIFVLGIFGNVLVCYVVFRSRAMQTVTNLFITNLALSDILLCVLAVPFTPLYTFLGEWVFGSVICHLVSYAQGASVYISTLTLMSIAIDRFFVIIYPFHPRMKISTCIFIIVIIWVFSILVTLPYGIYMTYFQGNSTDTTTKVKYYCDENWPSEKWRKLFGGFTTTMQFIFPFFIIKFCYICVSIKLNDRARSKPGSKNSRKEEADRERKRRTNRMLIAMVAIFLISWLPLNLINLINDFYDQIGNWEYYLLSFFLVHALAMSSTCYNPFLYAWLNENFRKEFKQVLPCCDSGSMRVPPGRLGNWRSERTCNGNNETQQESLLQSGVHRAASIRERKSTPPPLKTDSVEVENILVPNANSGVPGAVYDSAAETVRLRLITEEEPPPYDASMKIGE